MIIVLFTIPTMSGCLQVVGRQVAEGAIQAVESKVIELTGDKAREAIAEALKEGFAETDIDPNLDGNIDWAEWKSFQKIYGKREASKFYKTLEMEIKAVMQGQKTISQAITDTKTAVKKQGGEALSFETTAGLSGLISALGIFALNWNRNRTRKKDLAKKKDDEPKTSGGDVVQPG